MSSYPIEERLRSVISRFAEGVHSIGKPASLLDAVFPEELSTLYRVWDGAELFHGSLTLNPSRDARVDEHGVWFANLGGNEFVATLGGGVCVRDLESGDLLAEGTSVLRYWAGLVEAEALQFDNEGEYVDNVFTEAGEFVPEAALARERAILKRDGRAPGPRWRAARALGQIGNRNGARDELETLVQDAPEFSWGWFDLARFSEADGNISAARDEFEAAAMAQPDYEHNVLFWAHVARLSRSLDDEGARAAAAERVRSGDPEFAANQRRGAYEMLEMDDPGAAADLADLAEALSPRDLDTLALLKKLRDIRDIRDI